MKRAFYLPVLVSLLAAHSLFGEDLVTLDKKEYKNIKVSGETQDGIKVMHDAGISLIKKKDLPASFIAKHELTPPVPTAGDSEADSKKEKLARFAARMPIFSNKDGKQFKSSEITDVTPSEIKLMTSDGLVRLKFNDLPNVVKEAFNYNTMEAAKFDSQKAADAKVAEARRLAISNAASRVDGSAIRVRLYLSTNVGKAWLCAGGVLKDQDREVITSREGSSLGVTRPPGVGVAPAPMIYEKTKVQETVIARAIGPIALFGLPDYRLLQLDLQGRRTWSGSVYCMGQFQIQVTNKDGELEDKLIDAYETDHSKAIQLVAENGPLAVYSPAGDRTKEAPPSGPTGGTGTGFAITADGHLGTSAHVVKDRTQISVVVDGKSVPAKVLAMDEEHDVAIIKMEGVPTKPLVIQPTTLVKLGADVFTVGFPLISRIGATQKFTKGSVSANDKGADNLQISVPVQHGNSGGALCDTSGRVVGVIRALLPQRPGEDAPQNVNFASKSDYLIELAKSLVSINLPESTTTTVSSSGSTDSTIDDVARDASMKATYLIEALNP